MSFSIRIWEFLFNSSRSAVASARQSTEALVSLQCAVRMCSKYVLNAECIRYIVSYSSLFSRSREVWGLALLCIKWKESRIGCIVMHNIRPEYLIFIHLIRQCFIPNNMPVRTPTYAVHTPRLYCDISCDITGESFTPSQNKSVVTL